MQHVVTAKNRKEARKMIKESNKKNPCEKIDARTLKDIGMRNKKGHITFMVKHPKMLKNEKCK